jgi:hypothetical protein
MGYGKDKKSNGKKANNWWCHMRIIRLAPKLSHLSLSCLLSLLIIPVGAADRKGDQVRPLPKTQSKRVKPSEAVAERKGKKAVSGSLAESNKASATKTSKAKPAAVVAKAQADKSGKEKNTKGTRCAKCPTETLQAHQTSAKGALVKAVNVKTTPAQLAATKKGAAKAITSGSAKTARAEAKPLSSRLVQASLVSAAEGEARGKFGKLNSHPRRGSAEPEEVQPTIPAREVAKTTEPGKTASLRESNHPLSTDKDNEKDDQKRNHRPREVSDKEASPAYEIAYPDQIEVVEYGSTSPAVQSLQTLPTARPMTPFGAVVTRGGSVPSKRNDLIIPQQRVLEIQYQLASRGFYNTEPTGVYDETTIQAMWEFQKNYGLPATGYPTAHALKRLGLAN